MTIPKTDADWIGHTLGGRYKIEEYIDQGGMSVVYKASDPNLQRTVAIKIIHPHLTKDPQFVRRFEQEAAAVARLRHPNIIQVYDFNHEGRTYYMVMEYIPGQTLKDKLNALSTAKQRLPLKDVISIMTSICEAASYAHELGIIHRDLKPANVMLTPQNQVVLMDFGVAKMLTGQDETATGAIIGTAKYMSPEQARGERPDARSDIYALGVILYEMGAGQPPFDGDTTVPILLKHVNEPVPDIRQIQKDIPDSLVEIIEKALAKSPDDRYQQTQHMVMALKLLTRLGQTSGPVSDSQKTVSSKQRYFAETPPPAKMTILTPEPASRAIMPLSPKKSSRLKFWVIGLALAGLLCMAGLAGLGALLFGPFSGGAQATGPEVVVVEDDHHLPSSAGMVRIAAGEYTVGFDQPDRDHAPKQRVNLAEYWIDQHEVTNAQYTEFLTSTAQTPPPTWPNGAFPSEQANFPVMGVTWDQAKAYCEWAKKRLPTEAEWEVAARGAEDRLFPWGDNPQAVVLPRSGAYQVGTKMTNQSPFGVFDMAGNAWEWVDQPYAPVPAEQHVLRGGTNDFLKDMAYRLIGDPAIATMSASAGIRCVADKVNVLPQDMLPENVYYEDSFGNPGSGWPILAEGAFFYGYHPPDYYHVEVATAHNHAVVTHPPNFENVSVVADVLVDHTTTPAGDFRYGLVVRRAGPEQFYAFTVSPRAKEWYILKSSAQGVEVLKQGPVTTLKGLAAPGLTPDKTDTLQVDASGAAFVFRVNGQPVAQIDDADYANGEVGFYVETLDESLTHIHYDQLLVEKIEALPVEVSDANLLYNDQFTDPHSGWPTEDKEGEPFRYGYHPPDYYHIEARAADTHLAVTLPQRYQDAAVETTAFVDHTATKTGKFRYGLVVRHITADQFYAFTISPRQSQWEVLKSTPDGIIKLAEGPITNLQGLAPPGLTPDKTDELRVEAVGPIFVYQINGTPVVQITDGDYTSGEIGFFEENLDETTAHIHYEALTISKVAPE